MEKFANELKKISFSLISFNDISYDSNLKKIAEKVNKFE